MRQVRKLEGYGPLGSLFNTLSSMWLASVLLACMLVLTYFGTVAQVELGLHEAIDTYFKSWVLLADVERLAASKAGLLFLPFEAVGLGSIPYFPGGMTCMGLLALNMFLGGFVRMPVNRVDVVAVALGFAFVMAWTAGPLPFLGGVGLCLALGVVLALRGELRSIQGVVITHVGIAFMLIAGLVKTVSADEGKVSLYEGEASSYFDSYTDYEVAIWDLDADPATAEELVIPHEHIELVEDGGAVTFSHPDLPFDLVLSDYVHNSRVEQKGPNWTAASPVINDWAILAMPVETDAEFNTAAMVARAVTPERTQEALLWGRQFAPWTVTVDGRRFAVDMRHERYPMPFVIRLEDFIKDDHPGMSMARAFKSHVTKIDGDGEQKVLIQMNEPLRDGNFVLFQSSFNQAGGRELSVFSVVRNVSDKWPEHSLYVTTLGMLWVFLIKLYEFAARQAKLAARS